MKIFDWILVPLLVWGGLTMIRLIAPEVSDDVACNRTEIHTIFKLMVSCWIG